MAKFNFQAKNNKGQVVSGELEAANQSEVLIRLRAQQLTVLKVSRMAVVAPAMFAPKVKSKDLQIFTRQFATLINAGIPVVDSLKILSQGLRPGILKDASAQVKASIESGMRLADSMNKAPNVFDKLYCNMIQAGEEAGILDSILQRLAIYMEKSEKTKGQIRGAMIYPAVILTIGGIVIVIILVFVLPRFLSFFASAGAQPPALTMAVVHLSNSLIKYWYFYLGALFLIPISLKNYVATSEGKKVYDQFIFNAPIFGEVVQKSSIARLTRTLGTLLGAGVGLIQAIDLAARTSGNTIVEQALLRSKESVISGKSFASPLYREKAFPEMVVQMISIGERSGTLDIMLNKIAEFYEDEVETSVKTMTSLMEPLLMVFLGTIIGILVIAMYLPMLNMAGAIK